MHASKLGIMPCLTLMLYLMLYLIRYNALFDPTQQAGGPGPQLYIGDVKGGQS